MSLALSRPDSDLLARVSDFLVAEAELLDDRLLDTWFALFERAAHRVLPLQEQLAGQAPEDSLYIIDDDHVRLRERVDSILGGHTWMEQPRSHPPPGGQRAAEAGRGRTGQQPQQLRRPSVPQPRGLELRRRSQSCPARRPRGLRIVSREIRLDHETISAQRRISIIL